MKQRNKNIIMAIASVGLMIILFAAGSAMGYLFRAVGFKESNIVIVYILAVFLTSRFTKGYMYGICASFIATFAFNYFFTEPYYTFAVNDPGYLITFVIMTTMATITSAMTSRMKQNALEAIEKEKETLQERYRGNLLRAISHDLRTPLSGIMGTSEMLMDMTQNSDPRFALAEGIHKNADWLHSLVENILSLTRLQEGKLVLNKQPEAMEEVIGGAVNRIQQRAKEYEIAVLIPEEVMIVPMDARLMEQVFINLLDNAIKHTALGKEICISASEDVENRQAVISVMDAGEGIGTEDLPNIFQMFYTANSKYADSKKGIGLGLAICDAIVKAHGGTIEARNRADIKGAEFILVLPMEVYDNEHL